LPYRFEGLAPYEIVNSIDLKGLDPLRQVPKYLIMGSGRVARHMSYYLSLLEIPFIQWDGIEHVKTLLTKIDRVLVLVSDSAIEKVITENGLIEKSKIIQFSGALVTDRAYGAHPLMTFGNEVYDLKTYQGFPFIIENEGPDFSELMPGLPNLSYKIPRELKPLYHSLCVLSGNFTVLLWQKFFTDMKNKFGVPQESIKPFLHQTLINLEKNYESAFTGPLSRRDLETIQRNITALASDPYADVYRSFVKTQGLEI